VLSALERAHEQGIVHRDIKSNNIMVNSDGSVRVTDFGIAKCADMTKLTMTGSLIGTPDCMSPEQARGGEIDHRTDIYSIGVVMFEMLAGRRPFVADSPLAVLRMHLDEPPPLLREFEPSVPAELEAIVNRALEKEPARRFASAREMSDALEALHITVETGDGDLGQHVIDLSRQETIVLPDGNAACGRKKATVIAVIVIAMIGAAIAGIMYFRKPASEVEPVKPVTELSPQPVPKLGRIFLKDGTVIPAVPLKMSEDGTRLHYKDANGQDKTVEMDKIDRWEY
jgi:serine/threonine protein kinase